MRSKYILIILFLLIFLPNIVNASYNGGDGSGVSGGSSQCPNNTSKLCYWNNRSHMTVLVSLYYFDQDGSRHKIGKSVVYTNYNFRNISDFYKFNVKGNTDIGYNATGLKSYFYDNVNNFITLLNRADNLKLTKSNYKDELKDFFTDYCKKRGKDLKNCNQKSSRTKEGKYGFRVLIEPYVSGLKRNKIYFETIKEVADEGGFVSKDGMIKFSMLLHTLYDDVGIKSYSKGTSNNTLVSSLKSGYGYNIIDFAIKPDDIDTKCNIKEVGVKKCCEDKDIWEGHTENNTTDNLKYTMSEEEIKQYCPNPNITQPTCEYKIDKKIPSVCSGNNDGYIKDNLNWECAYKSSNESNKEVSDHYYDYSNEYCAIYCKEEINYLFPSGANVVSSGRYLYIDQVSATGSLAVLSPLTFKGNKVCRTTNQKGDKEGIIKRQKFENDFNQVEDNINDSYNAYLSIKDDEEADASDIARAYETYRNYVSRRESIISQINACSNRSVNYKFSPEINFSYDEPVYAGSWDLKKVKHETNSQTYYIGGNSTDGYSSSSSNGINYRTIMKYSCNESSGCTKSISDSYPLTDWFEKSVTRDFDYSLPDNVYRYIDKETGRSYNTKEEAGKNYVTVDRSNLPIHYSTNPGNYDFNIQIKTLGDGNKFEKYFFDKKTFNGKLVYSKDMNYKCSYNVRCKDHIINGDCGVINDQCNSDGNSENTCNTEGINVIYRPISLYPNTTFLNRNGDSRKPGSNWDSEELINTYINNNRGSKSYDVYKLEPMYEITLTPNLMKEIRKYNKSKNSKKLRIYDDTDIEQIGIAGYADYDSMTCNNEGNNCVSDIIRKWGVTGCSISNSSNKSYLKCGNSTKW